MEYMVRLLPWFTLTTGSVESSSTCTTIRSDGQDSPHAAPIDSWYTYRSTMQ